MIDNRRGRPIATYSGGRIHPLDPLAEEISIDDIAHGLANTCRYGGQCQFYYSVGTHSLYVSRELAGEFGVETQLYGLFHDAAEAYVTDVPRPVKGELDSYDDIESQLLDAVWEALGLDQPTADQWAAVMGADDRLFYHEADEILPGFEPPERVTLPYELTPCSPETVETAFLDRAEALRSRL